MLEKEIIETQASSQRVRCFFFKPGRRVFFTSVSSLPACFPLPADAVQLLLHRPLQPRQFQSPDLLPSALRPLHESRFRERAVNWCACLVGSGPASKRGDGKRVASKTRASARGGGLIAQRRKTGIADLAPCASTLVRNYFPVLSIISFLCRSAKYERPALRATDRIRFRLRFAVTAASARWNVTIVFGSAENGPARFREFPDYSRKTVCSGVSIRVEAEMAVSN